MKTLIIRKRVCFILLVAVLMTVITGCGTGAPAKILTWGKVFGGNGSDWANSIQQTSDVGYIVAGATNSKEARDDDMWVFKLDRDGNL